MNVININIDFEKGICEKSGISVVTGDFNSTKLVFNFDKEYDGIKTFELRHKDSEEPIYVSEIENNEVVLVGKKEEEGQEVIYSLFDKVGDYIFEVSLYQNDSKLTSMFGYITARQEQVVIGDEYVSSYLPIFDTLILEINSKLEEVDEKIDEVQEIIDNIQVDTRYAREMGDYAKEQGDAAKELVDNFSGTIEEIQNSIPKKVSDLPNDANYVTNSANNLTNYYTKEQTYTKSEIDTKVSAVFKYKGSVQNYSDLPITGQIIGDVYNIINADVSHNINAGDNVAWSGTDWDNLGGNVDLSSYYTKTQVDSLLNNKVDNSELNNYYNKNRTDELLNTKVNNSTFETTIQGINTELGNKLEQSDLTNYVRNTDYATNSTGGVIKVNSASLTDINSNGIIIANKETYANYQNASDRAFISKGTLENVITGKDLTTKSYVDSLVGDISSALDTINGESV